MRRSQSRLDRSRAAIALIFPKVLGLITIGHDSRIGANAVVVKPVPPDSVAVSLHALHMRIEELEAKVDGEGAAPHPRPASSEVWYDQDFSI